MEDRDLLITNIQRFSLHDGPGIRTTIFFKGCSLHCPWCSNPENINPDIQRFQKDGSSGYYGKRITAKDLVKECLKDKKYYSGTTEYYDPYLQSLIRLPGGVTFSGGEPLLQMGKLVSVCEELHRQHIHIAIETSLFAPERQLDEAIKNVDFFYVDIKILDQGKCNIYTGGDIDCYYTNLGSLIDSGLPIVIRVPVIGQYTDKEDNRRMVHDLLKKYKGRFLKVELIKEHALGLSKYESLGRTAHYYGVSEEVMKQYCAELKDIHESVEICQV